MRTASTIAIVSIIPAVLAASGLSGRSDESSAKQGDVHVSLAVTEGYRTLQTPLRVIIQNTSQKSQDHFEEWNSWGYGNLMVKWTDSDGKSGTATKVAKGWDRNFPSTVTLQPGEALVREVTFDSKLWEGWPDIPAGTRLKLQVIYQAEAERKSSGWSGKATSRERTVLLN